MRHRPVAHVLRHALVGRIVIAVLHRVLPTESMCLLLQNELPEIGAQERFCYFFLSDPFDEFPVRESEPPEPDWGERLGESAERLRPGRDPSVEVKLRGLLSAVDLKTCRSQTSKPA